MGKGKRISVQQRQLAICKLLENGKEVTILDLAKQFQVSEMTVRRDLDKLEQTGQVRRTHGGGMPAQRMVFEFDFLSRRKTNARAKQAIAAEAIKLVQPGHRIILDSGTTTLALAHLLRDYQDLVVITPSLAVASELQFSEGIQVVLLGGVVNKGSLDLTGLVTERMLELFTADLAFQGTDGIGADGAIYTNDLKMAHVDQKIRHQAERCYVLADSSKIGKTALARYTTIKNVDALITDDGAQEIHLTRFRENDGHVTVVPLAPRKK
ncbi:MAG: DeoR/GlpR family DNA-binding transcription regulator [Pirellulales bacterium]|nr:DeoR/GlpR family DNA-binding transcription regulator [Pirellulales bacterium]